MPLLASLALSYATTLLPMEAGVRRSFNGIPPFANEAPLWLRCNADASAASGRPPKAARLEAIARRLRPRLLRFHATEPHALMRPIDRRAAASPEAVISAEP